MEALTGVLHVLYVFFSVREKLILFYSSGKHNEKKCLAYCKKRNPSHVSICILKQQYSCQTIAAFLRPGVERKCRTQKETSVVFSKTSPTLKELAFLWHF